MCVVTAEETSETKDNAEEESPSRKVVCQKMSVITSGYATVVHGRGCNPHRSTATFAKPEMTSWMTS